MILQRRFIVSYSPKTQIVSSLDAITRKCRLDPSQYYAKTELIIRLCKTHGIKLLSLKETGHLIEVYLPNRFTRLYTKDVKLRIKNRPDNSSMDFFYVAAFLCSYKFGYPLITATRFGKDIPELDPEALKSIPIPNIPNELQIRIGTMFRKSRDLQEEANRLENAAILEFERLYENSVESN